MATGIPAFNRARANRSPVSTGSARIDSAKAAIASRWTDTILRASSRAAPSNSITRGAISSSIAFGGPQLPPQARREIGGNSWVEAGFDAGDQPLRRFVDVAGRSGGRGPAQELFGGEPAHGHDRAGTKVLGRRGKILLAGPCPPTPVIETHGDRGNVDPAAACRSACT